jgi:hypothetical protein
MSMADPTPEEAERLIDAMAPLVGVEVTEAYRPGVVLNLQIALRLAALVAAADLGDHDEPAPVFEA